jgi:hypothetical protein
MPSQDDKAPEGIPDGIQDDVATRIAEAGRRAAAEAETRRQAESAAQLPPELGGPKGPEPTRYGDWERKGIVSDF